MKFCGQCAAPLAAACAACGAVNPPGNRFCGQCATPLASDLRVTVASPDTYTPKHLAEKILTSRAALEGERKQVTVLFADVKGSMELLGDRDPEETRKLLDPVLTLMMEAVHQYEGTVNQVMGDGIMALFGAPLAHEDHAVRACYAALRMQESVKQYADEVRRSRSSTRSGSIRISSIRSSTPSRTRSHMADCCRSGAASFTRGLSTRSRHSIGIASAEMSSGSPITPSGESCGRKR
jgi:class 3 adenylate cyclase